MTSRFEKRLRRLADSQSYEPERYHKYVDTILAAGIESYDAMLDALQTAEPFSDLQDSIGSIIFHWNISRHRKRDFQRGTMAMLNVLLREYNETGTIKSYRLGNTMAGLGNSQTVKFIADMLDSPNPDGRFWAAHVLTSFDEVAQRDAFHPLVRVLNNPDEREDIRGHAAEALGQMHDRRAVPHLIRALEVDSVTLRWDCIFALKLLCDRRAIPALKKLVRTDHRNNPYPGEQTIGEQAAEAIGEIIAGNWFGDEQRQKARRRFWFGVLVGFIVYRWVRSKKSPFMARQRHG